ncbi:MAG TPA: response regulator, partial [Candidatus Faecousia faecipullorum]|nr:response regulator [Candidatus Faecousia faecipullorum]
MLNVLIVDDEAPIRHWLEYCVNQLDGFWVSATAKNGLQGIEEYKKTLPDIVITDVEMPNMSGLDMLKTIREIKPAYIIVLTSYDSFAYAREALVVGASEYILKTEISVESLRAVLNKAAGVLYKQNRDAKSEVEQSGQMMLRQLAMVGTQLSLTPDILRRKGITLDENLLVCGSIWSRNGRELSRIRQEIIRYPEVYNVSFVTIGYEELLMVCNLYREEALPELIAILHKKLQKTESVIGFSDVKPTVKQLPNALKEA